jgi:hypothetical protein
LRLINGAPDLSSSALALDRVLSERPQISAPGAVSI